ncbi:MAG: hypothetical protein K2X27_25020 [Candidatus Obscuribacterales bacterium]|nr:hypothetical protein [Candidatus Obscuribacterales bacterium]
MKRIRDRLKDFFYEDSGYLDWIRRLTGLWLIYLMPFQIYVYYKSGNFGPYHVPSWRFAKTFLNFPEVPGNISIALWVLYFFGCLALILGLPSRLIPALLLLFWFYCQCNEFAAFLSSPAILLALFLAAFCIYRKPRSLSRFLIKFSLSACYVFAALHKFHPEFLAGFTLYDMFGRGFQLRPELAPFVTSLHLPFQLLQALSLLVIVVELFIGIALWFARSRIYAVVLGLLMHLTFTFFISDIEVFLFVCASAYLAFFDPPGQKRFKRLSFASPFYEALIAFALALLVLLMPGRFFLMDRYAYENLTLFDRAPWSFAVYLYHQDVTELQAAYHEAGKSWQVVPTERRMRSCSSDNDMLALLYYLEAEHPQADAISIRTILRINSRKQVCKILRYFPESKRIYWYFESRDGLRLRKKREN